MTKRFSVKRGARPFALLAAVTLVPTVGVAKPSFIQCYAAQVQTEVTSPLGDGWQGIKTVQKIASASVLNGAGNSQILQCVYDGGAIVQKVAPAGMTCAPDGPTGFRCERGGSGGQQVTTQHSGQVTLTPGQQVDLDNTNSSPWDNDIWVQGDNERNLAFAAFADAAISAPQSSSLSHDTCSKASYGAMPIPFRQLRRGDYLCAKTNEGRVAAIRIDEVRTRGRVGITVTFASYNLP